MQIIIPKMEEYSKRTILGDFSKNDFILRLFIGNGSHTNARFISLITIWQIIIALVCYIDETIYLHGNNIGFFEDYIGWAFLVMIFIMYRSLQSLLLIINKLFNSRDDSWGLFNVLAREYRESNQYELDQKHIFDIISRKHTNTKVYFILFAIVWMLVNYLFQVHIPFFNPADIRTWAQWPQEYFLSYGIASMWVFFAYYLLGLVIIWYSFTSAFLIFRYIYQLIKLDYIKINPVSPDQKGGLSCLGDVSFAIIKIVSPGLIFMVPWIIAFGVTNLAAYIGMPIYIVILSVIFFLPLYSVHAAMKDAKQNELIYLSKLFNRNYKLLIEKKSNDSINSQTLNNLGNLETLYNRAELMPIWPFDATTLRKFLTLIIIPFILYLIQLLSHNALTKIIK